MVGATVGVGLGLGFGELLLLELHPPMARPSATTIERSLIRSCIRYRSIVGACSADQLLVGAIGIVTG
jgi:hypothetical protein